MADSLKTLDFSVLQQCMHCGLCLPTCPTYDATFRERSSPRGRIALMKAVALDELTLGPEFAAEMSYCLGCLACQTACPAGVDYATLLETARTDIERSGVAASAGRSFWRWLALEQVFMRPRLLRWCGRAMRIYQKPRVRGAVRKLGLLRLAPAALRRLEPQAPEIGAEFTDDLIREIEQPAGGKVRFRVVLLSGCVQDLVHAAVHRDTADVLLANGCEVRTPPVQPCCGALHAHLGEPERARELARRMLDLIDPEEVDAVISDSGGCGAHLKHYGKLLENDPKYRERAAAWARKLKDVSEWLVEIGMRVPGAGPPRPRWRVAYHDSCHLLHGQGIGAQPRKLLSVLPGIEWCDLAESTWCCGSAGVYNITQPEQSEDLLQRKIANVIASQAGILAAANPGCQLQIQRGCREAGLELEVVHPMTLIARAYREETIS